MCRRCVMRTQYGSRRRGNFSRRATELIAGMPVLLGANTEQARDNRYAADIDVLWPALTW
jgi:hypothetical protein